MAQCAHAIALYVDGQGERKIAHATRVSSGSVHRLAIDVAWVLDGLHKLACVPELGCPQTVSNQITLLARRVRWGAPAEALDVIPGRFERHHVPGFGRQRAMALVAQGIATLHDVLGTAKDKLVQLLRSDHRAQALLDAVSTTIGHGPNRLAVTHGRIAKELGLERLVEACNRELGTEYEKAIEGLLRVESSWIVTVLDDGVRQNVPDLLISLGKTQILLECKTCSKSPPFIKKEKTRGQSFRNRPTSDSTMRRVTLGKPTFDETSKKKAVASRDITLVEHNVFIEGLLRVHSGTLEPIEFLAWLSKTGVAEVDRLGGTPRFSL